MANIKLKINFEKALKQAEELENIAKEIENVAKVDLEDSFNSISRNWTGENSNNYIKKGVKVKEDIKKTAKNLKETAEAIREIVRRDKEAEEAAERIAQERSYSK
ncbi:hypothetical protein [Butyribacter sp.]|uniref:hypothetical protein n=1 Tax=Butyribacter sp. TaxID=2822465 RepID=UPI002A969776|nr:hypothetical protein [Butyribacter sp.]